MRRFVPARVLAATALLAACGALAAPALAGDLAPPAGPIAPTMKTLQEVEPRIPIHQSDIPLNILIPGSYYLAENLYPVGVNDPAVITINASNVTLDLRGFTIDCLTEVSSANDGIRVNVFENVTVTNGVIREAGDANIAAFSSSRSRFSALHLSSPGGDNLLAGSYAIVEDCHAVGGGITGIRAEVGSVIRNCIATDHAIFGFQCGPDCALTACVSRDNAGDGFSTGDGCVFDNCTAFSNNGDGFDADSGCVFRGCTARSNGRGGFNLVDNCTLESCAAAGNDVLGLNIAAIDGTNNLTVHSCTVSGTGVGGGDGIGCGTGEIVGCTVRDCGDDGITMSGPGAIRDCTAASCGNDGIQVTTGCIVERCNSNGNSQGGIHATFQGNLIRDNLCRGNLRGIHVTNTSNTIIRNRCQINNAGAGDYDVAGGNTFAPVNGNPAVAGPWDNM